MLEFTSDNKDLQEVISSKVRDNVILNIVHLVNVGTIKSMALTLFCKGSVIAGDVISGKEYFSSMADSLEGVADAVKQLYTDIGDTYYSNDDHPLNYIHLKNVAVKSSDGSFIPFNGGLLRMRIDEIDGHMSGRPD